MASSTPAPGASTASTPAAAGPEPGDIAQADAALAAGDLARALAFLERACTRGDQHACARQGFYLWRDSTDPQRIAEAVRLWTVACDRASDPLACANLGTAYDDGDGVPKDSRRAVELYRKACDLDDNFACGSLATALSSGLGADRDLPRAFAFADKGCRLGSPSSCTILGIAWVQGWSGVRDDARAVALFQRSCEQQDIGGCFQLGLALRDGRGVARDPVQGRRYLEQACALGGEATRDNCARELGPQRPAR